MVSSCSSISHTWSDKLKLCEVFFWGDNLLPQLASDFSISFSWHEKSKGNFSFLEYIVSKFWQLRRGGQAFLLNVFISLRITVWFVLQCGFKLIILTHLRAILDLCLNSPSHWQKEDTMHWQDFNWSHVGIEAWLPWSSSCICLNKTSLYLYEWLMCNGC